MIREATEADVPRIVNMGKRFLSSTPYNRFLGEDPDCMARLTMQLISLNGLLLSEQGGEITGMLGFIIHSHFISGEKMAGEVFWWVDEGHRGKEGVKLLREMEKRAHLSGATRVQMIAPTDKVAGFYRRIGYEFVESTYQRNL